MALTGPETVVPAPPLVPAPTGLLRSAQVINMAVPDNLAGIYAGTLDPTGGIGEPGRPLRDTEHPESWLAGTRFSPESAFAPLLRDACNGNWYQAAGTATPTVNTTGARPTANLNTRGAVRTQPAFDVEIEDSCSDYGWQADDYQGRALRALLAKEQYAVEAEFERPLLTPTAQGLSDGSRSITATTNSTTTVTSASFLATDVGKAFTGSGIPAATTIVSVVVATSAVISNAATTSVTGPFTVGSTALILSGANQTAAAAFALLQEAIARADIGQGMIHAPAFLVERWAQTLGLRFDTTGKLTSVNGNIVVSGNGYQGIGPDGTGGDVNTQGGTPVQWAYATDMVRIRRAERPVIYPGPDDYLSALDRTNSTITFRATRAYTIEWNAALHAAVKVAVLT